MTELSATPHRLRVLLITRNLPPLRGGMERLNRHMALELAREFDVSVVGPLGCKAYLTNEIIVSEVSAKPLWRFFAGALIHGVASARRCRPDVVLAGSGLAAPFAWIAGKAVGARVVIYVHGLDLIARHRVYRWFWRPFIRRADRCIANSHNTARLAASIGVPTARIEVVHPGVDLPTADSAATNDFRTQFGLGERRLLLSVGRLIARKGLLEFVERALPQIVRDVPDVCLVVLGDESPDLLHVSSIRLGERIRQRAAALGIERNLRFIGPQDDATLALAYRAADAHVFPVCEVADDVEGFGMVAIEAAAHGLPTVAFAVGGVPDAVADGDSGYLLPPGDYQGFAQRVHDVIAGGGASPMRGKAHNFAGDFSWTHFGERLRRILQACAETAR